jgi:predicted nuclease with RNAse H fold
VVLNAKREPVFHGFLDSDDRMMNMIRDFSPAVVAIDAPLSLPEGLCCLEEDRHCKPVSPFKGRESERLLAQQAIPCYFTTKRSIIKKMVYRGIHLARELDRLGYKVIEVYPYASKRRLFGSPVPRKTTAAGIVWLRDKIDTLVLNPEAVNEQWNLDLCDATIAAYTGLLYLEDNTQALGNSREGYIYIPATVTGGHDTDK